MQYAENPDNGTGQGVSQRFIVKIKEKLIGLMD